MPAWVLEKLCLGCQRCVNTCPNDAITISSKIAVVDKNMCTECEECLEVCMHGAITFKFED